MARRKAPENETPEEMQVRKEREDISNHATRSEKVAWERQFNNMQKILTEKIQPLEDKILELIGEKNQHMDEMIAIRDELVHGCIHPYDQVAGFQDPNVIGGMITGLPAGTYVCKFCNKKVALNDITK